jgi:uncharacterized coiled-coil protein SlyX
MKKVICILLAAFSLFTFVGCSGEMDALQKELTELQQTVAAQAEKIAELEAAKAAQAETITSQTEKVAELEDLLNDRNYLANKLMPKGAFCFLQTAYDNGWLTEEEVAQIAYRYNESGINEEMYDYIHDPSHIDEFLLYSIKKAYIEYEKEEYPESERTMDDLRFGKCYGQYGNCIVLCLETDVVAGVPMRDSYITKDEKIANSVFKSFHKSFIYVWYTIEE